MKKNTLSTAVVAGLAGVAGIANISNAVNLNPDGLGQVLIYPYYTVNADNSTLLSVVNTTNLGKVVKVRFLEGRNSREVLDFNLYLSPFDVWTAAIFSLTADGPANLVTSDRSCTVPQIQAAGVVSLPTLPDGRRYVEFRNFAYIPPSGDSGPNDLLRTREGYVEMIEMGTVAPNTQLAGDITHINGTPANCNRVENNWLPGAPFTVDPIGTFILPPSGGLYGGGAIVNVGFGTYINYNADAIERFRTIPDHSEPGSLFPNLSQARTEANGNAVSIVFDNGLLITSTWAPQPNNRTIDAVSAVFMYDNFQNEFSTEAALRARSEWVVTFPTKRFYVDPAISGSSSPIPPFTNIFPLSSSPDGIGTACEPITLSIYDREERTPRGLIDFSPPRPGTAGPAFCFEAQVVTFNQTASASAVFGSTYYSNISTNFTGATVTGGVFESGWVNVGFRSPNNITRPSVDGDRFLGLPVTGFWALSIDNANSRPGVNASYGGAFRHRGTRECVNAQTACN